jgi:flagellar motor switch/type III secretory pathway protein FliN
VESDADEGVEFLLRAAGNGAALSLRISEPALAAFRKRRCRPFAPPPIAKAPLAQVLAASRIDVEAVLGHARVSVQDLQNIATGDVIVLETGADDPVRLESTVTRTIVASAELARADGVLQLRIR